MNDSDQGDVVADDGHSRRSVLKIGLAAGAAGGLAWVAPSVLSLDAVSAGSVVGPPTSGQGTLVGGNGNSISPAKPVGTFSILLLVTAGDGAVPTTVTTGWNQIVSSAVAPFIGVYWALNAAAAPVVDKNINGNNPYAAQVFGFNPASGAPYTSAAAGGIVASGAVPGLAGQPANSAYVFYGSSINDAVWALPGGSGYNSLSNIAPVFGGAPDIFVALRTVVGTSTPAVTPTTFGSGTAKALQIALRT